MAKPIRRRRAEDVDVTIDIEQTWESFHAHAAPENVDIRPGDVVMVHGAPRGVAFGERFIAAGRATVLRADWLTRLWTRATSYLELTELYEVGFAPKETP